MPGINEIIDRGQKEYFKWQYMRSVKTVLNTRPAEPGNLPFTVLSMVHKRDVISYLVALKSFVRFCNPARVVIVCDPSIDAGDRQTFKQHVPHVELINAADSTHRDIPRGGCWERLFAITQIVHESYVVQLDADTVTAMPIQEVASAVASASGFVLGEEPNQTLMGLDVTCKNAQSRLISHPHIQTYSEVAIAHVGLPANALYVRGCAGFTGFPKQSGMKEKLLDFSARMSSKLPGRWANWGTEQVASNYLVSNSSNTAVLPFPKYGTPDVDDGNSSFVHFIGSMRFINNKYKIKSLDQIQTFTG
jgi:hypothetical protein